MKYLFFILFAMTVVSCGESVADLTVDEFITENNLQTEELDKGVHIVIIEPGNDRKPNLNSRVVVNYEGKLTDGTVFDSGTNVEFPLIGLIEGWRIGLQEIGEGGTCQLIIPPDAGYGSSAAGNGAIPANSVLVFTLDLLEVK